MLVLVTEYFKNGDPVPVYERLATKGRMLPEGVIYINSWVSQDLKTAWQVMETDDFYKLYDWMANWEDLVEFEVTKVLSSSEARKQILDTSKTPPKKPATFKKNSSLTTPQPPIPDDHLWEVFREPSKKVFGLATAFKSYIAHKGMRWATFDQMTQYELSTKSEAQLVPNRTVWPLPSETVRLKYDIKVIDHGDTSYTVCRQISIANDVHNWPAYQAFNEKFMDQSLPDIRRAENYLLYRPYGSNYAVFDRDGDLLVSFHNIWRDNDIARKVQVQFQSHVDESHPLLNLALVVACGLNVTYFGSQ